MTYGSETSSTIMLDVVMFERPLFSGPVTRLCARTSLGELAILPRHAALMGLLLPGVVRIHEPGKTRPLLLYVGGGFLEVQPAHVTVLAEGGLWPHEVRIDEMRELREDAARRMKSSVLFQDRDQAQIEWMQANAQIELWERANEDRGNAG
ncbi:MAG: ATP synthase F1 subunit epsilon [Pseudomonadota bacterium]